MGGFLFKLKILFKAIQNIDNWKDFPSAYFGLIKDEHVVLKIKSGMKVKIRTTSTDLDTFSLIWLIKEYDRHGFTIGKHDTIIDVGAHIGIFSLYASQFCTNGKIFCYEPSAENYRLLQDNLLQIQIVNVFANNIAVSNSNDTVNLYINPDNTAHSIYDSTSKSIHVKSQTLQNIFDINNIQSCDYLKLDCEGAEYEIIESLPDDYFRKIKQIYIEYHFGDTKLDMLDSMIKKLERLSFSIIREPLEKGMGSIYAKNNNLV